MTRTESFSVAVIGTALLSGVIFVGCQASFGRLPVKEETTLRIQEAAATAEAETLAAVLEDHQYSDDLAEQGERLAALIRSEVQAQMELQGAMYRTAIDTVLVRVGDAETAAAEAALPEGTIPIGAALLLALQGGTLLLARRRGGAPAAEVIE